MTTSRLNRRWYLFLSQNETARAYVIPVQLPTSIASQCNARECEFRDRHPLIVRWRHPRDAGLVGNHGAELRKLHRSTFLDKVSFFTDGFEPQRTPYAWI